MRDNPPLDCLRCLAPCCRMAGYVEVSDKDILRLANFFEMPIKAFEARHIVHTTRAGKKRIKAGLETCQFLGEDRRCMVYDARPDNCRGYACWEQDDETVYEYARFFQMNIATLRRAENEAAAERSKPKKRRRA